MFTEKELSERWAEMFHRLETSRPGKGHWGENSATASLCCCTGGRTGGARGWGHGAPRVVGWAGTDTHTERRNGSRRSQRAALAVGRAAAASCAFLHWQPLDLLQNCLSADNNE